MPEPALPVRWQAFHLAKGGHHHEEYEDAYAVDAEAGRFAIADGAAESSYAALWARLLVDAFVRPGPEGDFEPGWLEKLQRCWAAEVDPLVLPWYAEFKRDEGAFAALLGLVLHHAGDAGGVWQARAVGDCCLFQVRAHGLIAAFPLSRADAFTNHPRLLGSRPLPSDQSLQVPEQSDGDWQTGDRFFLTTDAVAHWFLCRTEAGQEPWEVLGRLAAGSAVDAGFRSWVEERRLRDGLRNDDVTLLVLDV
jgi:hypothetical protein